MGYPVERRLQIAEPSTGRIEENHHAAIQGQGIVQLIEPDFGDLDLRLRADLEPLN